MIIVVTEIMRGPVGPAFLSLGLITLKQCWYQGNWEKWELGEVGAASEVLVTPESRAGLEVF